MHPTRLHLVWFCLLAGCPTSPGPADAGMDARCRLEVAVGAPAASTAAFVPYVDGEPAEIVLGFQGFQMLPLDVRVGGAPATTDHLEVSATVTVADTAVQGGRVDRAVQIETGSDGRLYARGWLLFFNSAPSSLIAGHDGVLELIVHAGDCAGGALLTLHLVDDVQCVDFDASIPEASGIDGGIPDGAVACGVTL